MIFYRFFAIRYFNSVMLGTGRCRRQRRWGLCEQRSCSRGSPCGSCSSRGNGLKGKEEIQGKGKKINILGLYALTSLGCRDGIMKERGTQREAGGRKQSPCFLAAELQHAPKITCPVPESHDGELDIPRDPAGRRRQALPKGTLILSRKSSTFIMLKPERSSPSGKQQESE